MNLKKILRTMGRSKRASADVREARAIALQSCLQAAEIANIADDVATRAGHDRSQDPKPADQPARVLAAMAPDVLTAYQEAGVAETMVRGVGTAATIYSLALEAGFHSADAAYHAADAVSAAASVKGGDAAGALAFDVVVEASLVAHNANVVAFNVGGLVTAVSSTIQSPERCLAAIAHGTDDIRSILNSAAEIEVRADEALTAARSVGCSTTAAHASHRAIGSIHSTGDDGIASINILEHAVAGAGWLEMMSEAQQQDIRVRARSVREAQMIIRNEPLTQFLADARWQTDEMWQRLDLCDCTE